MPTPGPYEPCPCGSGEKYKFCCRQKDREAGATSSSAATAENPLLALSRSDLQVEARFPVDPAQERILRRIIAESNAKMAERGAILSPNADQLLPFIEPMVFGVGTEEYRLRTAVLLGQWLWRISVSEDEKLRNLMMGAGRLADIGLRTKKQQDGFRVIADKMRQRHKLLFPDFHQDLPSQIVLGGDDE